MLALAASAFLLRRTGLPTDGLWYDDAWEVTGASKAGLRQLLVVGTNHPGFTFGLMSWSRFVSGRSELMVWPVLAVGVATAPALYLALRRWQVLTGVAALAATALVVSAAHVQYSTRAKGYVTETLGVLGLAVALRRAARIRWRAGTFLVWVAACLLLGTLSPFLLVASAVAVVVVALHGRGWRDRSWRGAAVAVQGAAQAAYLHVVQGTFASARLARDWDTVYDGSLSLHGSPGHVATGLASHVSRLGQVVVAGHGAGPALVVVVAVGGLGVEAWRGERAVSARFLLALPFVAAVGAVVKAVPFGASNSMFFSPGWRASLWLLPSLLVGVAGALDRVVRVALRRVPRAVGPVSAALVVVAMVLGVLHPLQPGFQPLSGSRSAAQHLQGELAPHDLVIMVPSGVFPYAAEPGVPVTIEAAPRSLNGFTPRIHDPQVWVLGQPVWSGRLPGLGIRGIL